MRASAITSVLLFACVVSTSRAFQPCAMPAFPYAQPPLYGPPCLGGGCPIRPPVVPLAPPAVPAIPRAPLQAIGPPLAAPAIAPVPVRHGLILTPVRMIAPTGTDAVIVAGVCGRDGFLQTGERIEWTLQQGGVGQFVAPRERTHWEKLTSVDGMPQRESATFARSETTTKFVTLTRGTATPLDDVRLRSGEAWINVTSDTEGTSYVTAFAPSVAQWEARRQTAVIHWIDAQWQLPPPAVNPAGSSHLLTTTVTRRSNGAPQPGWLVRYEIAGGPPAGFGPQGAQALEVPTDTLGQASIDLVQQARNFGTNRVNIQIIRPIDPASGVMERLVVGSGATNITWANGGTPTPTAPPSQPALPGVPPAQPTAPPTQPAPPADITIRCTGPAQVNVGEVALYSIDITVPPGARASEAVVTASIPPQLAYLNSNPQTEVAGTTLTWRTSQLVAGTQRIAVNLRAQQPGGVQFCAELRTREGQSTRHCATTTIVAAGALEISATQQDPAGDVRVGQSVTFNLTVTNRGNTPAAGAVITDTFDPGLAHAAANSPIQYVIGDLPPGQSRSVTLTFRVERAGQLCHTAEVRATGLPSAATKACVRAIDDGGPRQGDLNLRLRGPVTPQLQVGQSANYIVEIANPSSTPLTDVVVKFEAHPALEPRETDLFEESPPPARELLWRIPRLDPSQSLRARVNCLCRTAAPNAWASVTAVSAQQITRTDRQPLQIVPAATGGPVNPAATIALTVTDRGDPVRVGDQFSYVLSVQNAGDRPDADIALVVSLPDGITFRGATGPAEYRLVGRELQFSPIRELRTIDSLTFVIQVQADRPGTARLAAKATSRATPQGVVTEETTLITGP
jgi:uncharacterized repeat protein (TIGR01451 family)